jgi:hypothetical protein
MFEKMGKYQKKVMNKKEQLCSYVREDFIDVVV